MDLLALLIKLPLALAVFLLVAYAGTVSRRIAGVLFTFPILNGIAIIAGADPVAIADAIYPLVIFNCALFAVLISFPRSLPPIGHGWPHGSRLFARVAIWAAAWFAGAYAITDFRHALPGASALLAGASLFALAFMLACWTPHLAKPGDTPRHRETFASFWATERGLWRVVFFCLAYAALVLASRAALDEKWVGMASALPLPGFFALAVLIDDSAAADTDATVSVVRPIRDTLFLGPVLVIPFNWIFAHALVALPHDAVIARYLLLFALWTVAALAVLLLVPRIAGYLDARSPDGAKRNPG
jgi:hypothetical protein